MRVRITHVRTCRASIALITAAVMVWAPLACVSERTAGLPASLEGCEVQLPVEAFGSTIVVIRDFSFVPAQVRVRPGAKVTWVNCEEGASHTSTADAGAWSSEILPPGSTFTREFGAAGELSYHCEPHPGMRGTVTVE